MVKRETVKKSKEGQSALRYIEGIGRRKTAVARVRLTEGRGKFTVNEKDFEKYFPLERFRQRLQAPFSKLKLENKFDVSIRVSGGGLSAQADAVRHGLARALVRFDGDLKRQLRHYGFLTRDPRMVERKKYGLKKARRAPQWAKR